MMQLRPTTIITSLALLSSAVYSSRPLAFTTPTITTNYNARTTTSNINNSNNNIFSKRVKRRVLAHTFLHHATSVDQEQTTSEFLSKKRSRQKQRSSSSMTEQEDDIDDIDNNNGISSTTLSMIVDSQKEFELNLGRAVDTLKSDYPNLLTTNPSWKIYHSDLEVIDPTGVSLHGLENYKMAFSFIHGVVKWFYCEKKSALTSVRVAYDWARKCIRYVYTIACFVHCYCWKWCVRMLPFNL